MTSDEHPEINHGDEIEIIGIVSKSGLIDAVNSMAGKEMFPCKVMIVAKIVDVITPDDVIETADEIETDDEIDADEKPASE